MPIIFKVAFFVNFYLQGGNHMASCEVCKKGIQTGHRISITRSQVSRRANRMWRSNIKKVQIVEKNGTVRKAKVCTRCLRSKKVTRAV
jgi:large subunit ribosomal protein L28